MTVQELIDKLQALNDTQKGLDVGFVDPETGWIEINRIEEVVEYHYDSLGRKNIKCFVIELD